MFSGLVALVPTAVGALVCYLVVRYWRRLLSPLLRTVRRG